MRSCGAIPGEVVVDLRQQALGQEEVFGEGDLDVARVSRHGLDADLGVLLNATGGVGANKPVTISLGVGSKQGCSHKCLRSLHRCNAVILHRGFVVEGELRESVKVEGGFESLVVMSMLADEFTRRRAQGLELA